MSPDSEKEQDEDFWAHVADVLDDHYEQVHRSLLEEFSTGITWWRGHMPGKPLSVYASFRKGSGMAIPIDESDDFIPKIEEEDSDAGITISVSFIKTGEGLQYESQLETPGHSISKGPGGTVEAQQENAEFRNEIEAAVREVARFILDSSRPIMMYFRRQAS